MKQKEIKEQLSSVLLKWYDKNARTLPWREHPSPYHIWISEIMLQQTRVEAVKSYYQRFISVLPTIKALAEADEDVYMKLWEGLGYYSRVKNLHKGAQQIMEHHQGKMPESYEALQEIAGIGPYTAAAIASIAFCKKEPAIDGNLLRIFARISAYDENIKSNNAKNAAREFFLHLIPDNRPGDFNQALMDLGATTCLPAGMPLCGSCPISSFCTAFQNDDVHFYPVMPPKKERNIEKKTVFLIHTKNSVLLQKRPKNGLLAGLYEFPNQEGYLSKKEAECFLRKLHLPFSHIQVIDKAKHIFTHKEWHMTAYDVLLDPAYNPKEKSKEATEDFDISQMIPASLEDIQEQYSIPSAFRKYKDYIWLVLQQ